jgi:hypothetical protein
MEPPSPWNFELAQAGSQAPQEPATQENAPARLSINREGSEQRLHFLWMVEAWLGQSRPTEEQTTDFSRLSDADLIALGKRVAARVHAVYPGDLRDLRTLTTWVLSRESSEGMGVPDGTVEGALYYALEQNQYPLARAIADYHSCPDGVHCFITAFAECNEAEEDTTEEEAQPAAATQRIKAPRRVQPASAPPAAPVDPPPPPDEPRPGPDSDGWLVQWREWRGHRGCFGIHPAQHGENTGWITSCYINLHPARRAIERGEYHWTTDLGEPTRL